MYANVFVEKRVLDTLGLPYESWSEGGCTAGIVSAGVAQKLIIMYEKLIRGDAPDYCKNLSDAMRDLSVIKPAIVRSNFDGIGFLLAYHISDDNYIDTYTDGTAKETDLYRLIMITNDTSRFVFDGTFNYMKEIYEKEEKKDVPPPPPAAPVSDLLSRLKKEASNKYTSSFNSKMYGDNFCARLAGDPNLISDETIEKFISKIGKSVFLANSSHDGYFKKFDKDILKEMIIIFQVSSGDAKFSKVTAMGFRDQACLGHYTGESFALLHGESGGVKHPLAEYNAIMKDNVTSLLFALRKDNFVYITVKGEISLQDRVMKEVVRRWSMPSTSEELFTIDSEYMKDLKTGDKSEYIKFACVSVSSYITKIKKELDVGIKEIGDLQRQLAEKMKMYNQYMNVVSNYNEEENIKKVKDKALDDFEAVVAMPQIRHVFIKDGRVNIFTRPIIVEDDRTKKKHEIGEFHIRLNMLLDTYDTNESIIIKNLKYPLTGGHSAIQEAPHIFSGGHMCHGNLANTVIECYANRDLYGLISAVIIFLESANTADYAGQFISKWPEVKEEPKPDETDDELASALKGAK